MNSKSALLESQGPLICGEQFDCSLWLSSYKGNSQYPEAEWRENNRGEMCPYLVGEESHSSKKPNVGLIIGFVCGIVAIIIITIAVVLVVMKKRAEKELARNKSNPLEECETHPPTNNTQEYEPETA